MEKWVIMGWFWAGGFFDKPGPVDPNTCRTFTGEVEVSEDGKFQGYTLDCHGQAIINGEIFPTYIKFCKTYLPSAKESAAKGTIHYELQTIAVPSRVGVPVTAGWKGTYSLPRDYPVAHSGRAACMMYPLD